MDPKYKAEGRCVWATEGGLVACAEDGRPGDEDELAQRIAAFLNQDVVTIVRLHFEKLKDAERVKFMDDAFDGYCKHCGRDDSESLRGCQCWNDE